MIEDRIAGVKLLLFIVSLLFMGICFITVSIDQKNSELEKRIERIENYTIKPNN